LPRDAALAGKWFRAAAEQSNRYAQYNLAVMLMKGQGVEQNVKEAVNWFVRACDQDVPEAQLALADLYASGQVPAPTPEAARQLYALAAAQGNQVAAQRLSRQASNAA
jgi:TPR repeat protein